MEFTHFNEQGRARMVDVTEKEITDRTATAMASVRMHPETLEAIRTGGVAKGDVLAVAQVAGIMAAKRTWEWIPMCHPVALTGVDIRFSLAGDRVDILATARCKGETGVEMEALTAASAAALTVYDMCKALQRDMEITDVRLLEKTGGKSGTFRREDLTWRK
ncbi:MAG: cyclic pyranopterin monophosphate synthase MoaC [Oscillospiraceae bacterium]|nr:cyclic pyranopterin monophosphate synthase MoaC [Oscillospiraceae bacterium]